MTGIKSLTLATEHPIFMGVTVQTRRRLHALLDKFIQMDDKVPENVRWAHTKITL